MKLEKYFTVLLIIFCISSYIMMCAICMTAVAENLPASFNSNVEVVELNSVVSDLWDLYINERELNDYISKLTKLEYDECSFLVKECKKNNIDPFIVLGVIKKESDFNPVAVGICGERGLGQLMENTAKPVAKNLGYVYDADKLFDSIYNLKLTITQLSYLNKLYEGEINKVLTAYNRGQQGLIDYISEGKSKYINPAMSDYSVDVLEYANSFKEGFVKSEK